MTSLNIDNNILEIAHFYLTNCTPCLIYDLDAQFAPVHLYRWRFYLLGMCTSISQLCVSLAYSGTSVAEVKLFMPRGDTPPPTQPHTGSFPAPPCCTCPLLGWHALASPWQRLCNNSCPPELLFGTRLEQVRPTLLCVGTSLAAT